MIALVALASLALDAPAVRADEGANERRTSREEAGAEAGTHWQSRWPRFHPIEAAVMVAAEAIAITVYFGAGDRDVRWSDPAPLDPELRAMMRLHAYDDQHTIDQISDALFITLAAWPVFVDALLLAGALHGDTDTAWQMLLIDLEALAIAHLVTWLTNRFTGRVRPRHVECAPSDSCADRGMGPVASFASGHTLMAFTGASLTCVHHLHHPWMLGGMAGAALACGSALLLATTVGAMRVMADLHWASDVALSAMIGSAIGWGIPLVFHYLRPHGDAASSPRSEAARSGEVRWAIAPGGGADGPGLELTGTF